MHIFRDTLNISVTNCPRFHFLNCSLQYLIRRPTQESRVEHVETVKEQACSNCALSMS